MGIVEVKQLEIWDLLQEKKQKEPDEKEIKKMLTEVVEGDSNK
jgi:hypothetical protein